MPTDDETLHTYDWCWECCSYHADLAKECPRQRPFRGADGSAEDRDYRERKKRE